MTRVKNKIMYAVAYNGSANRDSWAGQGCWQGSKPQVVKQLIGGVLRVSHCSMTDAKDSAV